MSGRLCPTLHTERLILRETRLEGFEPSVALWSDEAVVRHISGSASSRSESWGRLLRFPGLWSLLGYGYWTVIERESGRFVGQAGLADFKREMTPSIEGVPEAGYVFSPDCHGKGYATEAMRAVMAWSDEALQAARCCAIINPDNRASIRVAEKLGFALSEPAEFAGRPVTLFWRDRVSA